MSGGNDASRHLSRYIQALWGYIQVKVLKVVGNRQWAMGEWHSEGDYVLWRDNENGGHVTTKLTHPVGTSGGLMIYLGTLAIYLGTLPTYEAPYRYSQGIRYI